MIIHVRANDTDGREEWRELYSPLKQKVPTFPREVGLIQYNFDMMFAIGQPRTEEEQDAILEEAREYDDILQGNFLDTYHNISYKVWLACTVWDQCFQQLTHLHYVDKYCKTPFIVKLDDDVVILD